MCTKISLAHKWYLKWHVLIRTFSLPLAHLGLLFWGGFTPYCCIVQGSGSLDSSWSWAALWVFGPMLMPFSASNWTEAHPSTKSLMNVSHYHWFEAVVLFLRVPGRPAKERPPGLGFCPFLLIFGRPAPAIRTHPKFVELIRNKQNMNGTLCKAHFIPEKLTAWMWIYGRQHVMAVQNKLHFKKKGSSWKKKGKSKVVSPKPTLHPRLNLNQLQIRSAFIVTS